MYLLPVVLLVSVLVVALAVLVEVLADQFDWRLLVVGLLWHGRSQNQH